jgi:hypothetical protein
VPHPPPGDSQDGIDPSEVDATLKSHDPRSGIWEHLLRNQWGGGGTMDDVTAFQRERGYWPPGSGMRKRTDDEADRESDPVDSWNPVDPRSTVSVLTKVIRQELLALGIAGETLLSSSIGDRDGIRWLGQEAAYQLRAFVFKENLAPVTAKESKTVTVRINQVSPATWVDHWKLTYGHRRWAAWWVRRHPARVVDRPQSRHVKITAEFDLDKHRLYPHAPRSIVRALGEPVTVAVMPRISFDWTVRD